jgi:hypothetical protein
VDLVRLVQSTDRLPAVRRLVGSAGPIWTHPGLLAVASAGGYALERGSVLLVRGPVQPPSAGARKIGRQRAGLAG